MKTKRFLFGLPAVLLALGLVMAGCDADSDDEVTYEDVWDDLVNKYGDGGNNVSENDLGALLLTLFDSNKKIEVDADDQQLIADIRAYTEKYPERLSKVHNSSGWTYDTSGDSSLRLVLMYRVNEGPVFDVDLRWRDVSGHRTAFVLRDVKLAWVSTVVEDLVAMTQE
jgi:hypothetical protein